MHEAPAAYEIKNKSFKSQKLTRIAHHLSSMIVMVAAMRFSAWSLCFLVSDVGSMPASDRISRLPAFAPGHTNAQWRGKVLCGREILLLLLGCRVDCGRAVARPQGNSDTPKSANTAA